MNNYCTNCGKKLKEKAIKCDDCNTYVVDLKVINRKKIFRVISIVIITLIIGIMSAIFGYNTYYKNLNKSLYKEYLEADFKDAEYVKYDACRECDVSCDASCVNYVKIVGCFKYYYKSKPNVENPDIVVFSNKGNVSVDIYSSIINKYGFTEVEDEDEIEATHRRSYLDIEVDYINSYNITDIYNMVTEIIDVYNKHKTGSLSISIDASSYANSIYISNYNNSDKSIFEWSFNRENKLSNPSLNDVVQIYKPYYSTYDSTNSGYNYYD